MASASHDLGELNYTISREMSELNKNSKAILRHLTTLLVIVPFDSQHSPVYINKLMLTEFNDLVMQPGL